MRAALLLVLGLGAAAAGCLSLAPGTSDRPPSAPPTATVAPSVTEPSAAVPTQTVELTPASSPSPTSLAAETSEPTPEGTPDPNATPTFDVNHILGAEITVFNLSNDTLAITAVIPQLTAEGDLPLAQLEVEAGQAMVQTVLAIEGQPLPYRIEFAYPPGATAVGGTCTIEVAFGDDVTFVAVPEGVVVSTADVEPAAVEEMTIATAPICNAEIEGPLM